jgi:hypothetical protein
LGTPGIIRLGIQLQYVFHVPDIVGTDTGNTPLFTLPRLEVVFWWCSKSVV